MEKKYTLKQLHAIQLLKQLDSSISKYLVYFRELQEQINTWIKEGENIPYLAVKRDYKRKFAKLVPLLKRYSAIYVAFFERDELLRNYNLSYMDLSITENIIKFFEY